MLIDLDRNRGKLNRFGKPGDLGFEETSPIFEVPERSLKSARPVTIETRWLVKDADGRLGAELV